MLAAILARYVGPSGQSPAPSGDLRRAGRPRPGAGAAPAELHSGDSGTDTTIAPGSERYARVSGCRASVPSPSTERREPRPVLLRGRLLSRGRSLLAGGSGRRGVCTSLSFSEAFKSEETRGGCRVPAQARANRAANTKPGQKGPFDSGSFTEGVVATGAGSTPGCGAGRRMVRADGPRDVPVRQTKAYALKNRGEDAGVLRTQPQPLLVDRSIDRRVGLRLTLDQWAFCAAYDEGGIEADPCPECGEPAMDSECEPYCGPTCLDEAAERQDVRRVEGAF